MLDRIVSKKPFFFFQYQIDQHCFYTYMMQKQFFKDLFFTKDLLVNSSRYLSKDALQGSNFTKRDEKSAYINQNNKSIYLPPISCVACIGNKFSKLYGHFCNYKETYYVLVTIFTLFYLVVYTSSFMVCFSFNKFKHLECLFLHVFS